MEVQKRVTRYDINENIEWEKEYEINDASTITAFDIAALKNNEYLIMGHHNKIDEPDFRFFPFYICLLKSMLISPTKIIFGDKRLHLET